MGANIRHEHNTEFSIQLKLFGMYECIYKTNTIAIVWYAWRIIYFHGSKHCGKFQIEQCIILILVIKLY